MKNLFKLLPRQWKLLATAFSNISQGIILFSLATLFVPEAVGLPKDFSPNKAFVFIISGFVVLAFSVILSRKERK